MRFRRLGKISFGLARRGVVVAAALAYWAIAVGVPLPVTAIKPSKDTSVAFPCMHRACGCQSAAGCKEHCCCFTDEQKLAWAAEHQVDPAPFVSDLVCRASEARQAFEQQPFEHQPFEHQPFDGQPRLAAACCAHEPSAPSNAGLTPAANVGPGAGAAAESANCVAAAPPSMPASETISISAYRQCHGFAPFWTLAGASLPPPDAARYEFPWELSGSVFAPSSMASALVFTPPTPPPRG